jgi:acetyl esterase/lipase
VVIFHIGGYHGGSFYDNINPAPNDLTAAGFYVFSADYPLAPPNSIKGQPDQNTDPHSGRPPEQTRAVEAVIQAAINDSHCLNSEVGVLGGSAGASHAAFAALDVTNTGLSWPFWAPNVRPNCFVCLSGQYDFAERDADVYTIDHFIHDIENYTASANPVDQYAASPVALIPALVSSGPPLKPMYLFRSFDDSGSPASNSYYLWDDLTLAGFDQSLFRFWNTNSDHAFALWNDFTYDTDPETDITVKDRVIWFFQQYLPN